MKNINAAKKLDFFKRFLGSGSDSPSSVIDKCDRVSKISIYLLVFLLPLLFFPWTANVLEFNKQALLIILAFVSFFAWLLKVLISGKVKININITYIPIAVLVFVYGLSTVFSLWRYGSFWGWPQVTSESLVSLIGLSLLYVLIINIFSKKEAINLIFTAIISSLAVCAFGALQLLGLFIAPVSFAKSTAFNTVGGVLSLGVFSAVMMPLSISGLVILKKNISRILCIAAILLQAIVILLVNIPTVWWLLVIGSALVFAFAMQRRDFFDGRWLILPMFFLALGLLFIFFKFSVPGMPERPAEFYLKHGSSLEIAKQSLQTNPVFGTGPGTFNYAFSKYKGTNFNQGDFWNVGFDWASSKFITLLVTGGILGALGLLGMLAFFVYLGIRFLFNKENNENQYWNMGVGALASFAVLSAGYFLCSSTLTLDYLCFFLISGISLLIYSAKKEFELKSSSLTTLGFTFAITVVFVFGLGIIILEGQRYVSAASYLNGMKEWQDKKAEIALSSLNRAASISPNVDVYWRELSQAHLQNIDIVAERKDLSDDEKSRLIQVSINKAVVAVKSATDANPSNVSNWSVRGSVYQNLIGSVQNTGQWAVDAYKEAMNLSPFNPLFPAQAGASLIREAASLPKEELAKKTELLNQARQYLEKSLELKPNYALAYVQMAEISLLQDNQTEMISALEKAKEFAPSDIGLAFRLGLVYYERKDYEKARADLERAILLNPNYSNALYFLGLTYDELGIKDMAKAAFNRVSALNPNNELVSKIIDNLENERKALYGLNGQEAAPEEQ